MSLYPLKFLPIYLPKVWGGRRLEALGRELPGPAGEAIGESWEITDLGETSADGAGGQAAQSVVAEGPLAGRTLHDLIERYGPALIGDVRIAETGRFPLLVKYLDARENLSVQVHPSAAYAARHPQAHLKAEAWYIVEAEEGAVIYKGVRDGVGRSELARAVEVGTVERLLLPVAAQAGDCFYLPSGTCHAVGAGLLVAEIQTPSDTTFRLYDWGRTGRSLHIEEAMECIEWSTSEVAAEDSQAAISGALTQAEKLVRCEHFQIDRLQFTAGRDRPVAHDGGPRVWMVLDGQGRLKSAGGTFDPVAFGRGETILLPAAVTDAQVVPGSKTTILDISLPRPQAGGLA
ncbi:MAG: class I mannose-6-phosphate isomerase [Phycisphaerae bacterium]|nr:class I mannose-6-phosphate isomerase [Phycisphaerae bacterium]